MVVVPTGGALSKLVTRELIKGSGAKVKAGDSVTVSYVGVLYKSGKVFARLGSARNRSAHPGQGLGDPGLGRGTGSNGQRQAVCGSRSLSGGTAANGRSFIAGSELSLHIWCDVSCTSAYCVHRCGLLLRRVVICGSGGGADW